MIRRVVSTLSAVVAFAFAVPAFGAEPAPAHDPAMPAAVVVMADKPALASAPAIETPRTETGFTFAFGVGAFMPLGDGMKNVPLGDLVDPGVAVDTRTAFYPSRHAGIVVGANAATVRKNGCEECSGIAYRIPLGFEYAVDDRLRGIYLSGGVDVFNGISTSHPNAGTLSFRGDFREGYASVGYRWLVPQKRLGLSFQLSGVLGEYDHVKVSDVPNRQAISTDLETRERSLHYGFLFTSAFYFGT